MDGMDLAETSSALKWGSGGESHLPALPVAGARLPRLKAGAQGSDLWGLEGCRGRGVPS